MGQTTAGLFTLKRQLGKALDIYADVLRHPAFPEAELNANGCRLGTLPEIRNEPRHAGPSWRSISSLRHGASLRPAAVRQIDAAPKGPCGRVEDFYRQTIRPEGAGLIAVGDITLDELTGELEKVLGGWRSAARAAR